MIYALTLPLILLAIFKLPVMRDVLPTLTWLDHFRSYAYLIGAAFVIFAFRLIPYWIFDDMIFHFLGGRIVIALVYEYLVVNFDLVHGMGLITLAHARTNLILLLLFASFFSVFSELYEFISKDVMGYQFDSSGLDTWLDLLANMAGSFVGYKPLWMGKYGRENKLSQRTQIAKSIGI